jgi:hypothetical protein
MHTVIQGGAPKHGQKTLLFQSLSLYLFLEAYGSPEKGFMVYVGLLATHLCKETAIFLFDSIQAAAY